MNVKYFKDTDTALLEFSGELVEQTREVSENVYIDLDGNGNLVSMTVEHARQVGNFPTVTVEELSQA
jgi:uncharacterized protein YuzE